MCAQAAIDRVEAMHIPMAGSGLFGTAQGTAVRAKVLAVANQKGGVGKTTTSLNLGAALARKGKKTLVVDMDPHACATIHLALFPENLQRTMFDILQTDEITLPMMWRDTIKRDLEPGFDFAAATIRLSELEMDFKTIPGRGLILKKSLEQVRGDYEYIIVDCPPQVGVLLVNCLVAADMAIIPIQTDFLALHGLMLIFDTMRALNRALPEPIKYRALPTMYDRRAGACRRVLNLLRVKMKDRMFDTVINMDTKFREAGARGKTIFEIDEKTRGAREYELLANEVVKL